MSCNSCKSYLRTTTSVCRTFTSRRVLYNNCEQMRCISKISRQKFALQNLESSNAEHSVRFAPKTTTMQRSTAISTTQGRQENTFRSPATVRVSCSMRFVGRLPVPSLTECTQRARMSAVGVVGHSVLHRPCSTAGWVWGVVAPQLSTPFWRTSRGGDLAVAAYALRASPSRRGGRGFGLSSCIHAAMARFPYPRCWGPGMTPSQLTYFPVSFDPGVAASAPCARSRAFCASARVRVNGGAGCRGSPSGTK